MPDCALITGKMQSPAVKRRREAQEEPRVAAVRQQTPLKMRQDEDALHGSVVLPEPQRQPSVTDPNIA